MALKIIAKQYTNTDKCFSLQPTDDPYIYSACLIPNDNSRYKNCKDNKISLLLFFPKEYPFYSPTILFSPPLFHPNIETSGILSLPDFKERWHPAITIDVLLHSILSILDEPLLLQSEECSPVNSFAAELWNEIDLYNQILNEGNTQE